MCENNSLKFDGLKGVSWGIVPIREHRGAKRASSSSAIQVQDRGEKGKTYYELPKQIECGAAPKGGWGQTSFKGGIYIQNVEIEGEKQDGVF